MIITFQIFGEKLKHATRHQFGAIVAHIMQSKNFSSVKVHKTMLEVSFEVGQATQLVDSVKITNQLNEEVDALLGLEPYPCNCGCGQYLAIGPCLRQSGVMVENQKLEYDEKVYAWKGEKSMAIKTVRQRTGLGLKDAKDLVDDWCASDEFKQGSMPAWQNTKNNF